MNAVAMAKKLTDKEKDDLLKEILGKNYSKAGNNLPILKNVITLVGNTSDIATLAEIIPILNSALANSRLFSIVSSGASVFSILLFPVGSMLSIIDAYQSGIKMYTYRSIAYTITAWAYNKPIPTSSKKILINSKNSFPVSSDKEIKEKQKAWKNTSQAVIKNINHYLITNGISKDVFKLLLQAMSEGSAQKLCTLLLKGFEKEFKDYPSKAVWKSNYSIRFPL